MVDVFFALLILLMGIFLGGYTVGVRYERKIEILEADHSRAIRLLETPTRDAVSVPGRRSHRSRVTIGGQ